MVRICRRAIIIIIIIIGVIADGPSKIFFSSAFGPWCTFWCFPFYLFCSSIISVTSIIKIIVCTEKRSLPQCAPHCLPTINPLLQSNQTDRSWHTSSNIWKSCPEKLQRIYSLRLQGPPPRATSQKADVQYAIVAIKCNQRDQPLFSAAWSHCSRGSMSVGLSLTLQSRAALLNLSACIK